MRTEAEKIANRHVARCLSRIEEVFHLPEICCGVIRQEMHFTAQDVVDSLTKQGAANRDDHTDDNQ